MKLIQASLFLATAASASPIGNSLRTLHSHQEQLSRALQFDLGELGGCPSTCSTPDICTFYESQAAGELTATEENIAIVRDACDAGTLWECAPSILSGACGLCGDDGGGSSLLASLVSTEDLDTICVSCDFLDCCDAGGGYDVCGEGLPADFFGAGVDVVTTTSTVVAVTTSGATGSAQSTTVMDVGTSTAAATEAAIETEESSTAAASAEEDSITPTPFPTSQVIDEAGIINGTVDDFLSDILGQLNDTGAVGDDFLAGLIGNESSSDDFLGGGSDDIFGGIGDFIGGLFGGGETGDFNSTLDDDFDIDSLFNGTDDDFLASLFQGVNGTNGTEGGLDDMLGSLFINGADDDFLANLFQGVNGTNGTEGGLGDMLGGLIEVVGGIFGAMGENATVNGTDYDDDFLASLFQGLNGTNGTDMLGGLLEAVGGIFGGMEGNTTDWIDKGNFSGWVNDNSTFEDFVSDVIENMTGILDELISNITIPEFCPTGSCSVDGFCDCFSGDFMQCNEQVYRDACEADAFFGECGPENFQDFCSNECSGDIVSMQDMVNMYLCSMCTVASCCHEKGSAEECIFSGPLEFNSSSVEISTNTSGLYEGTETEEPEEVPTEEVSDEETSTDATSGSDEVADSAGDSTDTTDTEGDVASAVTEEGSSSASTLSHMLVATVGVSLILANTF